MIRILVILSCLALRACASPDTATVEQHPGGVAWDDGQGSGGAYPTDDSEAAENEPHWADNR